MILSSVTSPPLALADSQVVIFSETQQLLTGVNYAVSGTVPVHHTICDLDYGTGSYDVLRNGVPLASSPVAVGSSQTIVFDSPGGGQFVIAQHTGGGADTIPPTGSVVINNNAAYTTSLTATLTLSAFDTGSGMGTGAEMRFSNDNVNWSTPEPYATTKQWTLSSADGTKRVYARFKDAAGNWMATSVSDSILLDTTPPTGSVSINAGQAFTSVTAVNLTLSASDTGSGMGTGAQMRFSADNITWSAAEPYAASKPWTLTSGDGVKTVYVRYRDAAGNWMAAGVSDSITLDATPPSAPEPPLIMP